MADDDAPLGTAGVRAAFTSLAALASFAAGYTVACWRYPHDLSRARTCVHCLNPGRFASAQTAVHKRCHSSATTSLRSLIAWARVSLALLVVLDVLQLYYEVAVPQRVVAPSFGIVRPLGAVLAAALAWSLHAHPLFRYMVRGCRGGVSLKLCTTVA
jgi:uncharacterized membrane protein YidH (DUF202 family)